jgi:hypothetical protein
VNELTSQTTVRQEKMIKKNFKEARKFMKNQNLGADGKEIILDSDVEFTSDDKEDVFGSQKLE